MSVTDKNGKPFKPPYPRWRELNRYLGGMSRYVAYNNQNGQVKYTNFSSGTQENMADVVTPGFRRKSEEGAVIITPMYRTTGTKLSLAKSLGRGYFGSNPNNWWSYTAGPDTEWCMGLNNQMSIIGSVPKLHSGTEIERIETEASTKCRSNRNRGSTNMWENLAEVNTTLAMVRQPLASWYKFERKARIATAGMSAASAWLMYRYGIKPLVSSVSDVVEALEEQLEMDAYGRAATRGQATSSMSSTTQVSYSNGGTWQIRKDITETVTARAMSLDAAKTDFQKAVGLSSKDLVTLPWELIPYSFVVDWFVNVGDFIGAIADAFYPAPLGSCITTTIVQSATWENLSHTSSGQGYVTLEPHLALVREDVVTKYRTVGLRSPGIVVKQNFRLDDAVRVGDAVALVGQQILGRFGVKAEKSLTKTSKQSR